MANRLYKFFLLLITVMGVFSCFSDVLKTSDISEIEKILETCDENTMVIFDNDGIITIPVDVILQSQNRKLLIELEQKILFSKNITDEDYINYQSIILKDRKLKSVIQKMLGGILL